MSWNLSLPVLHWCIKSAMPFPAYRAHLLLQVVWMKKAVLEFFPFSWDKPFLKPKSTARYAWKVMQKRLSLKPKCSIRHGRPSTVSEALISTRFFRAETFRELLGRLRCPSRIVVYVFLICASKLFEVIEEYLPQAHAYADPNCIFLSRLTRHIHRLMLLIQWNVVWMQLDAGWSKANSVWMKGSQRQTCTDS